MASSRADGSFHLSRGHRAGVNARAPMNILQQQQRHQNAVLMGRFYGNVRSAQGFPLAGPVYAVQSQAVPSVVLPTVAYLPPLQGSHLFLPAYRALPAYAQVIPNPNNNNIRQTVGSYNQPIHNLQHKSVIGETSRRKDRDSKDVEAASHPFGLRGLMDVLSGRDSNVTALAVGRDKETFNSYDNLYCTYNFPWSARRPHPLPQYKLPSCYLRHVPRLHPRYLSELTQDTLFFIFYSTPNEEAQLLAANELHNRGWFYHKQLRVWLIRVASDQPGIKTKTYEEGSYVSFDPCKWKYVEKDLTVFYDMLEKRPSLPPRKPNQLYNLDS